MKMRRKLAALLASAMIVSVMPMTAFAASTNLLTKEAVVVAEDTTLGATNAPSLEIDLKHKLVAGEVFYLELENAKWNKTHTWSTEDAGVTSPGAVQLAVLSDDKTLSVKAKADTTGLITIPMYAKITGGEAVVKVISNQTVVTSKDIMFAVSESSDAKAKLTVADAKVFVEEGEVAKVTMAEPYPGAFNSDKEQEVRIRLDDKNFTFTSHAAVMLKGTRGFSTINQNVTTSTKNELVFKIAANAFAGMKQGILEVDFTGVKIVANKDAVEGNVTAYVSGDFIDNETVTLAKYGDYSTNLTTEKVKEFTAGTKETVKFKLDQVGKDIIEGRRTTFTFSEDIVVKAVTSANSNTITMDKNEFVVSSFKSLDANEAVEFEVEIEIPAKFTGDIDVKAEGRSLAGTKEVKLADVKAPVTVKVEAMSIKAGVRENKGGKITITEVDKGMLNRGTLVIQLPKELMDDGVVFQNVKDLKIETTGGITFDDAVLETSTSAIKINLTSQSKEAGSVEISGFDVKAQRTILDGAYEIEIGGSAISDLAEGEEIDAIATADFILVGNIAKTVVFKIGETDFTVDGKTITMDAAARISKGRTMVPLRYLSYALGIDEESIKFNSGVVTIFKDAGTIIQVTNGDNNLVVNGMTIPMTAAAEIVEGRTYVPVTEIGSIFGVTGKWDAAAQTATFK